MLREVSYSVNHFVQAFSIMTKPWAIRYVISSAILSFVTALIFIFLAYQFGDNLGDYIYNLLPVRTSLEWLNTIFKWLSRILLFLIIIFLFKYIVLIITAPIMSLLSEKVELHYGNEVASPIGIADQLKSVVRGTTIALGNVFKELIITIPVLIVSIIPGVIVFTTPFLFLVQSYFAGFGNYDFYLERHFNISESKKFARYNKIALTTNGALFLTLLFVPIIGVLIAPAAGTIASTLGGIRLMENSK